MMEKSLFGIGCEPKTYAGKRKRASCRQSCLGYRNESVFDQLLEDENNKKPFSLKKSGEGTGVIRSKKSHCPSRKGSILKSIQNNYSCVNRKSSVLLQTKKKKVRTKILKRNKENARCTVLYESNSDPDDNQLNLYAYNCSFSRDPLAESKKFKALLGSKLKPKLPPSPNIRDINVNSCFSNSESELSKVPPIITHHSNSSIDSTQSTPAKPNDNFLKNSNDFVEGSSNLFYKNSSNRNRGETKTRKKLSYPRDNEDGADNYLCEYVNELLPRDSNIIDDLFSSFSENENELCSKVFNPGIVSTPIASTSYSGRSKLSPNQFCEVNDSEDHNCAKPLSMNQSDLTSQNIRVIIDETHNIPNDVTYGSNSSLLASSSDSEQEQTKEKINSINNNLVKLSRSAPHVLCTYLASPESSENLNHTSSSSSGLKRDTGKSMTNSSEDDSSPRSIRRSVSLFSPDSNKSCERSSCKLVDEDIEFENIVSNLTNRMHLCSFKNEEDSKKEVDESTMINLTHLFRLWSLPNDLDRSENFDGSVSNEFELVNNSHSSNHKYERDQFETEPVLVINEISTSLQMKDEVNDSSFIKLTTESEMKGNSLLNETRACQTEEVTNDLSSLNVTTKSDVKEPSLSEIVCLSPISAPEENISENMKFAGWSQDEYKHCSERKEAFKNAIKESEPKFVQPEDIIPPHLKLVTNRRKKTMFVPKLNRLNEENDNLDADEVDSHNNTRNGAMPSQTLQMYSQNQTSLHTSRFLERLSMIPHSIVLATGKKWRRSFITLKNIREYGFQTPIEHENLKGRCWRKNVENLISNQVDENLDLKEIGESSKIRTGLNESIVNSNYTFLDSSKRPNKARFSLCVNQKSPPQQNQTNESSGLTSSSDTSKLSDDKSYFSFAGSQQNSRIENCHDLEAGDYSRSRKVSLECYDIRDHFSAKERVLRYCKQTEPLPFEECFNDRLLLDCKKIGEGVYGEVFMLKRNRAYCSVLKIIPIEGDQFINGEKQKKFDEIVSELVISIELSDLRKRKDYYTDNFAELQKCWCVYGKYPKRLIDLWDDYNDLKGSDNDSPKVFDDSQLYIILELSHGGEDVESFVFNNAQQTLSIFIQVAHALAVAEQAFNFEHRDLHWGNILVSKTKQQRAKYRIGDFESVVRLRGLKVTIIDYTLSRISINNCVVFNDIGQDPDLFIAEGDFQFEVYRLMRDEVNNIWNKFVPKTNIYWLRYLLDKMVNEVKYRRKSTRIHEKNLEQLEEFYALILGFASCHELICHSYFTRNISAER